MNQIVINKGPRAFAVLPLGDTTERAEALCKALNAAYPEHYSDGYGYSYREILLLPESHVDNYSPNSTKD